MAPDSTIFSDNSACCMGHTHNFHYIYGEKTPATEKSASRCSVCFINSLEWDETYKKPICGIATVVYCGFDCDVVWQGFCHLLLRSANNWLISSSIFFKGTKILKSSLQGCQRLIQIARSPRLKGVR